MLEFSIVNYQLSIVNYHFFMQDKISASFADSKPHYALLDGLRGVAALLVVWYHVFEGYAFAGGTIITTVNHGYLAVDFFFLLSGFVVSYAYDDKKKKSTAR
jgi:peptidoglycan/LPS O-acetylase OafA/YrhL